MQDQVRPRKGLTRDECVKKAKRYIRKYGKCLLVFDVRESRKFPDVPKLHRQLENMIKALNRKFSKHFPKNDLAVKGRFEKGFSHLYRGDDSWTGINNAEIILEIIQYQQKKYPNIPLWWTVAKDGYTEKDWINI